MTTLYKLTDSNDRTHGGCQWGPGVTVETNGEGGLCGPGLSHWYLDPVIAMMLNPIHAKYDLSTAHLWRGEGEIVQTDRGLKVGCTRATTLERIPLPQVTVHQRIRFGILCALAVPQSDAFKVWADGWLSGRDRSERSALVDGAGAGSAAARGAHAAELAALAAEAEARAATRAALAAAAAAREAELAAAVWAAAAAARTAKAIDLIGIARQAVENS